MGESAPAPLRTSSRQSPRSDSRSVQAACPDRRLRSRCRNPRHRLRAARRYGNDWTSRRAAAADPRRDRPGRNRSNCAAYSAVKRRASQPSSVLSMVRLACTQARSLALAEKTIERLAELVGLRSVLGVIDHGECPARKGKRRVERLRLGARTARRRGDDLERRAEIKPRQRRRGFDVVGLYHDLDIELLWRVVQLAKRADQPLDRLGFAVERSDDGVDREGSHHEFGASCRQAARSTSRAAEAAATPGMPRGQDQFDRRQRRLRKDDDCAHRRRCEKYDGAQHTRNFATPPTDPAKPGLSASAA